MIFALYKFYQNDIISENFESTPSIADDWNAVNQLAQMSRQLMNGGLTVPGGLTVTGPLMGSTIIANTNLDVNAGGGGILSVDSGGVHVKRKIDSAGWSIDSTGAATVNSLNIGNKNVGALLDSLQTQINSVSGVANAANTKANAAVPWNAGVRMQRQGDSNCLKGDAPYVVGCGDGWTALRIVAS